MHRLTRITCTTSALALTIGLAISACSSDKAGSQVGSSPSGGSPGTGHGGSGTSAGGSPAQPGAGSSSGGSSSVGAGGSSAASGGGAAGVIPTVACPGLPFDGTGQAGASDGDAGAVCTGVSGEAESIPVDMFIIMDSSQSMGFALPGGAAGMRRWDAVRAAVQSFVSNPSAAAIGAGIGFFSISGGGDDALDCNAASYANPVVGIGPLATNGPALLAAIDAKTPSGLTPTIPALQGAISYAKDWAAAHIGRATVVVLVTDGYPTQCGADVAQVAAAAQAGYDTAPHIKTYVVGVGDQTFGKFNLNQYAQAGGTRVAYITDDNANATNSLVTALLNITNSQIACDFALPKPPDPTMQLDVNKVQVVYTPANGAPLEVPKVANLSGCASVANGGWYYDDPNTPTKISVCPCTCASFAAGRVDVRLGCAPRISLR